MFDPLSKLSLTHTPLTADFKGRKLGGPKHPVQRSCRYLQQLGGF
jgi:hypothetical protein